jgi:hypothetical protein
VVTDLRTNRGRAVISVMATVSVRLRTSTLVREVVGGRCYPFHMWVLDWAFLFRVTPEEPACANSRANSRIVEVRQATLRQLRPTWGTREQTLQTD